MISRKFTLILFSPLLLLLIPAIAMQFTTEVNWSPFDFLVGGILMMCLGLIIAFYTRAKQHTSITKLLYALLIIGFILIWMELAVGIFGTPFAGT